MRTNVIKQPYPIPGPPHFRVRNRTLSLDDLPCVLNPVQVADLALILERTLAHRRPTMVMSFLGWGYQEWADSAQLPEWILGRWFRKDNAMPLGGALRLSKVVGQLPEILFKDWGN